MTTAERAGGREEDEAGGEEKWKSCQFFLVGNIPSKFRSADLRTFFSQFVEKEYFVCFHYRHRPEQIHIHPEHTTTELSHKYDDGLTVCTDSSSTCSQSEARVPADHDTEAVMAKTRCGVVAVGSERGGRAEGFVKMYGNKNWSTADGGLLRERVRISELKVDFKGRCSQRSSPNQSSVAVPWEELRLLPELNPPSVMPRGNVGTPLSTFMELIRTCKLPSHVIRKLQLEFPKSRSRKRYGAVAHDYGTEVEAERDSESESEPSESSHIEQGRLKVKGARVVDNEASDEEEDTIPPDDDHDAEEWERYEAFHNDVDKQERSKERLYENELEVVWDKGSSGLVFYTDASYWDQQEGDFDEKCAKEDDWDVDMSAYYDGDGGDKDARDMRDMEMERRLREGKDTQSVPWTGLAGFEKHTKGFGSKVLRKSGWTEGSGVGASQQGISEPLEAEGQHPRSKKGLGYRGEKLDRNLPPAKRRATRDVIISTIYDRQSEQEDTVLRTAPSTTLKYRDQVQFLRGEVLTTHLDNHSQDVDKDTLS